jgi:hypothetical protein
MIDEPNAHNHRQHLQRPEGLEDLEADTALPPEVEALVARVAADGAAWQSRLPDPRRVAERIRAIPRNSASLRYTGAEGDDAMFEDTDSAPEYSRPMARSMARPVRPSYRARPASLVQRLGSLAAVVVVVALVGGMALVFYAAHHPNGGEPGGGAAPTHPAATSTSAPPACGPNFSGAGSQSYQSTLTTAYGTVPLPPLSRTVPNDASGGVRGYDICSAGTAFDVTAFMEQNLPPYGWTLVSSSGGVETWQSSTGTIDWSVPDPLEWNINWRVPLS